MFIIFLVGVLYHRWGKKDKARAMYMKALQINPNMTTTISNLKKLSNAPWAMKQRYYFTIFFIVLWFYTNIVIVDNL